MLVIFANMFHFLYDSETLEDVCGTWVCVKGFPMEMTTAKFSHHSLPLVSLLMIHEKNCNDEF